MDDGQERGYVRRKKIGLDNKQQITVVVLEACMSAW